jgi:murein DD-endopeptidase MepM/ murein hydrolase activator NlpD
LFAPSPYAPSVSTGTFKYGDSLDSALGRKIPYADVCVIEKGLKKAGAGILRPGDIYAVSFSTPGAVLDFSTDGGPCRENRASGALGEFVLARGEELFSISRKCRKYEIKKSSMPVSSVVFVTSGTLQSSLWEAMSDTGLPPAVIMDFADIFAWKIDFLTEPRKGDSFALVWEERKTALGAACGRRITGAAYKGVETGEERGFYYGGAYYDEKGASLRRAFLRAPLSYRRISSYFSKARFHPVLRIYRPHNGIDYAAASGTPVSAISDGTVAFKGRKGGYGNFIELKHGGAYTSGYGHLRGFAKGLRTGARVNQGDVIGYVGMTGLATGPHLDFSFKVNGKFADFLKFRPPAAEALKGERLRALAEIVPVAREKLERLLSGGSVGPGPKRP